MTVGAQACPHPPAAPRLDHVIAIVPDLSEVRASLAPLGFRLKPGRLHPNNLLNFHIKFRDGSELELMTLAGPPGDANASDYAALLAAGAGGAYVALSGMDLEDVAGAATRLGLAYRRSQIGSWQFLSFSPGMGARAVFFGTGWSAAEDPDSILNHPNGVHSLHQAWVEGGQPLESLLQTLGAVPCDSIQLPDGRQGREWGLAAGSLVVLRPRSTATQSRPVGVVLATSSQAVPAPIEAIPGFWIAFVQIAATAN